MKNKILISVVLMTLLVTSILVQNNDYTIKVEDGTLYGTLNHKSYERLVIFISGSGPTNRDGNSDLTGGRNDAIKELAKELNQAEISTFAYDKRSSGKSVDTFDLSEGNFQDFVDDAKAVLGEMNGLGYKEIYIIGHSQGALVSEIVGQDSRVAGVVSLCGTVNRIDQVLLEQFKQYDVTTYQNAVEIINKIREDNYDFEVVESLELMFSQDIQTRFLHSWMTYDPMEYIKPISNKMLFIYGDQDVQVSANEISMLKANEQYVVIKDMNHVLKMVKNDYENTDSYINPIYQISPELVDIVLEFIL